MASRVFERIADGYPRCENVFQGTPFEHAVNEADTRCVGLKVPEFIPPLTATKWYRGALSMMASHGAPLSRPPNSTAICAGHQYRTARFMRFPCTCSYDYAGTRQHRQFHYGAPGQDAPVLSGIDEYLRITFGLPAEAVPDCWVINAYADDNYIDWHTDEDPMFGALDGETEIISISLGPDGVFCVRPRAREALARSLGVTGSAQVTKIIERDLRLSIKLSHGDLFLMGGWHQREFLHATVPATEWSTTWAAAARTCARVPTQAEPRLNLTGRYVVNHACALKRLPRCLSDPISPQAPPPAPEALPQSASVQTDPDPAAQQLEAEITQLRRSEEQLLGRLQAMQNELLGLEEQTTLAVSAPPTKRHRDALQARALEIGRMRTEWLRTGARAAFAEFSFAVASKLRAVRRFAIEEACGRDDPLFQKGFARHSRLHRVLLPLACFRQIFFSALSEEYRANLVRQLHICFRMGAEFEGKMWLLKGGTATQTFTAPDHVTLHAAMLELALDFHAGVHRFGLRPPAGHDREEAVRQYVATWRDLVLATKIQQAHCVRDQPRSMPPLPASWGEVASLEDMPCVLWVYVPQRK